MYEVSQQEYLMHHGVKGMKWGVRKQRPTSGHAKSIKGKIASAKQKHEDDLTRSFMGDSRQSFISKNITGKRDDAKPGLTEEEARLKAQRRMKAEKYVAAAAGITITAAAGYLAYRRLGEEFVGQTIRQGVDLHTITAHPEGTLGNRFFASFTRGDRAAYRGLYGYTTSQEFDINTFSYRTRDVYDVSRQTLQNLRVPSRRTAANVFQNLYRDDADFRQAVNNNIHIQGKIKALQENLTPKQLKSRNIYDLFNTGLIENDPQYDKFYNKLKEMGYSAIRDVNDTRRGGYATRNPVIVFDMGAVAQNGIQRLENVSADSYKSAYYKALGRQFIDATPALGAGTAAILGAAYAGGIKKNANKYKDIELSTDERRKKSDSKRR